MKTLTSRDLPQWAWDDNQTLFAGYLASLETPAAKRIVQFMEQGGTCVFFSGLGPVRHNLLMLDEMRPGGCLPWLPGMRQDLYRQRRIAQITRGQWRARLLHDFDATSQIALASVPIGSRWEVARIRPEADVLLNYDDGMPALATRRVGTGQLVSANFSPDAAVSELGKHGVFVALAQVLAQNLSMPDSVSDRIYVGQPLAHRLPTDVAATDVRVLSPQGQTLESTIAVDGAANDIQVAAMQSAGIYRLRAQGRDRDAIAVNLNPLEGDLSTLDVQQVRQMFVRENNASQVVAVDQWQKPIDLEGRPLWGWMILLVMVFVGIELALLSWWRR